MQNYELEALLLSKNRKKAMMQAKREDKKKQKFEESKWRSKAISKGNLSKPESTKMNQEEIESRIKEREEKGTNIFGPAQDDIPAIPQVQDDSDDSQDSLVEIVSNLSGEERNSNNKNKDSLFEKQTSNKNQKRYDTNKKPHVYYHCDKSFSHSVDNHPRRDNDDDDNESQTPAFNEQNILPADISPNVQSPERKREQNVKEIKKDSPPSFNSNSAFQNLNPNGAKERTEGSEGVRANRVLDKGGSEKQGVTKISSRLFLEKDENFSKPSSPKSLLDNIKKYPEQNSLFFSNQNNKYGNRDFFQAKKSVYFPRHLSNHKYSLFKSAPNPENDLYLNFLSQMVKTHSRCWPSTHQFKWMTKHLNESADLPSNSWLIGENEERDQAIAQEILRRQQNQMKSNLQSELPMIAHQGLTLEDHQRMREIYRKENLYRQISKISFGFKVNSHDTAEDINQPFEQFHPLFAVEQHSQSLLNLPKYPPYCPPAGDESRIRMFQQELADTKSKLEKEYLKQSNLHEMYREAKFRQFSKFYSK